MKPAARIAADTAALMQNLREKSNVTMQRRIVPAEISVVGEDEVRVVISTAAVARDGHILVPQGVILENYRKNPIVLWQHDPEHPVGNSAEISIGTETISALVRFAPVGTTVKADETRKLVKSGVVKAVSVGFDPIDGEPLDPKFPRGGMRFTKWELLEVSFVSVPADTGAEVTARAEGDPQEKKRMTKKKSERTVVNEYKRIIGDTTSKRGLYDLAYVANLLAGVGHETMCAKWEAAMEEDNSAVPDMMVAACNALAEAFKAMAVEEVDEMLAEINEGQDDDELESGVEVIVERDLKFIKEGKTPAIRTFRRFFVLARAGKPLSKTNADQLTEADGHHTRAMKHHRALADASGEMSGHLKDMGTHHEAMRAALDKADKAVGDAAANPDDAAKHIERAAKALDTAGDKLGKAESTHGKMNDTGEDMTDSHAAIGRSLKRAQSCVRAVLDSSTEDTDSTKVQKSGGTEEDEGDRAIAADADRRRREADLLELTR